MFYLFYISPYMDLPISPSSQFIFPLRTSVGRPGIFTRRCVCDAASRLYCRSEERSGLTTTIKSMSNYIDKLKILFCYFSPNDIRSSSFFLGSNIILNAREQRKILVRILLELNVIEFNNSIPFQQSSLVPTANHINPIYQRKFGGKWIDKLHAFYLGRIDTLTKNNLDLVHARHRPYLGSIITE
jgi:hypothetical protein